jgi:hypothetical protein
MSYELRVRHAQNLRDINRVVHDYWFWTDNVLYDEDTRTLEIRFGRASWQEDQAALGRHSLKLFRWKYPELKEWVLRIANVRSYELTESEGIGRYPFNVLEYSEEDDRLSVRTGIPLRFEVSVDALDIYVRETDRVHDENAPRHR